MTVLNDLRQAARSLARTPGVAAALVLTIALGIGSNAAVYAFVGGLAAYRVPPSGLDDIASELDPADDAGFAAGIAIGLSRVGTLLRATAAAVFVIACANVACLLLARTSARSRETSVRVALGASRGRLATQLLADSIVISAAGGAFGMVLATWTVDIIPALFFDRDAAQLVFAPDLGGVAAASVVCVGITIACGMLPLIAIRDDRPAAVLQREGAGPSKSMRRVHKGLIVTQMSLCCVLVITAGLLVEHLHATLRSSVGRGRDTPVLATIAARPRASAGEAAAATLGFFRAVEKAAQSVTGVTARAWVSRLPGSLPTWQRFRVEQPDASVRDATMDVAPFTRASLSRIAVPPMAGRLFGGQDTPQGCLVAIVNDVAAGEVFGGDAVGRAIGDPAGQMVQIVGVVAARRSEDAADSMRPTIFYYADQAAIPVAAAGPARFRVPAQVSLSSAMLDTNIVSASFFGAMGWTVEHGRLFANEGLRGCRVGMVNQEAADRYFGGDAVGAAVIDGAGRRTEIVGVVRSTPILSLQRRVEPSIYFPMTQDVLPGMTLVLGAREASKTVLTEVHRRLDAVPGRGPAPVSVRTLESHLSMTALAPLRIATTLVAASAVTALALGVVGLSGAMIDAARRRRREIAVRIALGAPGWRVIRHIVSEAAALAGAGAVVGMFGSLLVAQALTGITADDQPISAWVWLAAPLVLLGAIIVASILPAVRALAVDPITITRADHQ